MKLCKEMGGLKLLNPQIDNQQLITQWWINILILLPKIDLKAYWKIKWKIRVVTRKIPWNSFNNLDFIRETFHNLTWIFRIILKKLAASSLQDKSCQMTRIKGRARNWLNILWIFQIKSFCYQFKILNQQKYYQSSNHWSNYKL